MRYLNYIVKLLKVPNELVFSIQTYMKNLVIIRFEPSSEDDENRAGWGLDIRRLYFDEFGHWPVEGPCTMLEMMAGLSINCNNMLSPDPGNTEPWMFFLIMLNNITTCRDIYYAIAGDPFLASCVNYQFTLFAKNGVNNLHEEDIWVQANHYQWETSINEMIRNCIF